MSTNKAKLKRHQLRQLGRLAARSESSAATSRPSQRGPSPSREQPAGDNFVTIRNGLRRVAAARSEWAGIPMPLDGERLVIEPSFPNAEALAKIGAAKCADERETSVDLAGAVLVNSWFSSAKRCDIHLMRLANGRIEWGVSPAIHGLEKQLRTLGCAEAWGIEQETKAVDLLASLVPPRHFKQYLLTGSFLERSPRSGVTYMFRRLRPTVAITTTRDGQGTRILCSLCLHPIAYYADSWAGAMAPTDDVVAHLTLMRGDEAMFWRRANQHPAWRPEAGL